jgi:enamidase
VAGLLIRNIAKIITGDIKQPIMNANSILIKDGKISKVGKDLNDQTDKIINANENILIPGLIDSHFHPVFGDFTPRQNQLGYIDSELHGGVTTLISAGEAHLPGRPKDVAGTKALAILAAKSFANFRPNGAKVLGGGLILEKGLQEKDFEELAKEGVKHVGEIGLGSVNQPEDAIPMVKWARKYGMVVMMHTGGTSIPGSSTVTADQVKATNPDIVAHINGGPTAIRIDEAKKIIAETSLIFEIVHCGNPKVAVEVAKLAKEYKALERLIIGNDAPSGTGVIPLGILRVLNLICSLGGIKAEEAIAMATGNTARVYKLNRGVIKEGLEADLVLVDTPMGSVGEDVLEAIEAGDIPAVSVVVVDGEIRVITSRNTPPPKRKPFMEK